MSDAETPEVNEEVKAEAKEEVKAEVKEEVKAEVKAEVKEEVKAVKKPAKKKSDVPTFYGTGRRKSAVARVWLVEGSAGFEVNNRPLEENSFTEIQTMLMKQPLEETKALSNFKVKARVHGGGKGGQAGALQLGIARALVKWNEELKPTLRKGGFLTRDPREKERKKFGQKGARRKFQFVKR